MLARRLRPLFLSLAAPNEIKVFTDELAGYREHTLETHLNKARTGPLRLMQEHSYGLWHNWEFSLQLPLAFTSGSANSEGYRAASTGASTWKSRATTGSMSRISGTWS